MECLRTKDKVHVGCAVANGLALLAGNAATHADHYLWALSLYRFPASQLMKDFFLCLFTNGARVQEKYVGFLSVISPLHTMAFLKKVTHACRVVLIHLAAMCLDKDFGWRFCAQLRVLERSVTRYYTFVYRELASPQAFRILAKVVASPAHIGTT